MLYLHTFLRMNKAIHIVLRIFHYFWNHIQFKIIVIYISELRLKKKENKREYYYEQYFNI